MDIFQFFHPTKIHQNTIESLTKLFKFNEGCPPRPVSKDYQQDGSHEPECIHVLGLRIQTSAIGKRTFFLHASCPHTISAKAPEQQFTKIQLTSTTTSPPAQRNHNQHSNITSAMKSQRNHTHNEITSATKSQAQQHHQRNEITSTTNAPAE